MEHKARRLSGHHKRASDPFIELSDNILSLDDADSKRDDELKNSLYEKALVVPITMISFLLSLCFVTRQERAWRVAQHDNGAASWIRRWFYSEPYQDLNSPTAQSGSCKGTDVSAALHASLPAGAEDSENWYTWRKKHRKMAKLQLKNAFAMQHTVAMILVAGALFSLIFVVWALRRALYLLG
ncbi:hypothetical protein AAFC00_003597 [Neodothiora populina]|uniref:Uncharacterized protein n=1 Tax=Neodothiora populina TaxID=2781224 RepID=A0ABR3PEQ3_9PEZI